MDIMKKLIDNKTFLDVAIKILTILVGFLFSSILLLLCGYSPVAAYTTLLQGAFNNMKSIGDILLRATPFIMTGLAAAYGFKTGVINIGISGQMYVGGFFAVMAGVLLELPSIIHIPIVIIAGILGGMLWATIPAFMKFKLNTSEVFTTIMMNYIALWVVQYFSRLIIPSEYEIRSASINETASLRNEFLSSIFGGSYVNLGFIIAIIFAIIFYIYFEKTKAGYEMKAVGSNINAAKYAGINIKFNSFMSLIISGGLAGLAGTLFYCGYTNNIELGVLPPYGFEGITIALMGSNSPIGIVFVSLFFGLMSVGASFMSAIAKIPNELVSVIIAIIIYFSAATIYFKDNLESIVNNLKRRKKD